MNKNDIPKELDVRTYYDYLKLGDVNTKHYLMLAELIDNSISSFENKYRENWKETLEVTLEMNFLGAKHEISEYKVVKNSFISFEDNGFGMHYDELRDAVKLNKKRLSNSKMNVHGRGLKQSAFFFGVDLSIETSNGEESWGISQKLSEQENYDAHYTVKPFKGNRKSRGTKVIISNIRQNRIISLNTWTRIKKALEYRYIKYITSKNKKLVIKYSFNNKEEEGFFQKATELKISFGEAYEWIDKNEDEFMNFLNKVEKNIHKARKNSSYELNKKTLDKTCEIIIELFKEASSKNDIIFEFNIDLIIGDKNLPALFWMLPSKMGKFRGIRLFEGDRAINHPGFQEHETRPYMDWKKGMATGSTENRFAGSIDLSVLGIKSMTDKSLFAISDEMKNNLNKEINTVWFVFDMFTIHARKEHKHQLLPKITNKDNSFLENICISKYNEQKIVFQSEESNANCKVWTYTTSFNKEWKIHVSLSDKLMPDEIFDKNVLPDECVFEIVAKIGHPFWNEINKLHHFFIEAVYPIALLVASQHIELTMNDKDSVEALNISGGIFHG